MQALTAGGEVRTPWWLAANWVVSSELEVVSSELEVVSSELELKLE